MDDENEKTDFPDFSPGQAAMLNISLGLCEQPPRDVSYRSDCKLIAVKGGGLADIIARKRVDDMKSEIEAGEIDVEKTAKP